MNNYPVDSIEQDGIIKIVSCKEKGRKFILKNDSGKYIEKIHVDGILIKSGNRCDYAVDVEKGQRIYLVELKGKNKEHAFEQLYKTLVFFKEKYNAEDFYCRAVLSKDETPKLKGKFQKMLMKAKNEKKCTDYDYSCTIFDKDVV